MISVVVRTYTQSRLGAISQYLTHGARHLAAETYDGSPFGEMLAEMSEPNSRKRNGLLLTQMALSLGTHEHATPDMMFDAGRDFIGEMHLANRPWIAVLHGPPEDAHMHLHLVVRLDDKTTGEVQPLARLPRAAFEAATAIAGRYGWDAPRRDNHERRREPRAARSVGVWHGERSLHSWVGEIAGPRILPQIDEANSWVEVGAALAEFGLRYVRTERGAVIEDCSCIPARKVPASALAFRASAKALERRFGPTPPFPGPEDAARNPRAFVNDIAGRSTGVGTPAEHRAFAAEHATWNAVWLPVRREHLDAQRAREASRKAALAHQIKVMRNVRDDVAENRAQRLVANSFIREYRSDVCAQLKAQAQAERRTLADLPFARRPPSRFLEWLRERNGTAPETRLLHAPAGGTSATGAPEGYRLMRGLTGETEWWTGRRRVAIDRAGEIVICDPTCLPVAVATAEARWSGVRVGGDQAFRDKARAAANDRGVGIDFDRRPDIGAVIPAMPDVSAHVGTRRAMAIARHLGAREISLDGRWMNADVADRALAPRDGVMTVLELSQADAIVLSALPDRVAQMENAGYVPAVTVGTTAIFALDHSVTSAERTNLTSALLQSYGGEPQRRFSLEGAIRYGPADMCDGFRQLLTRLRPRAEPVCFAERIRSIQAFLDGFAPEESMPVVVAAPQPPPPKQTQSRKRGSRSR